jgi:hypothetical protein
MNEEATIEEVREVVTISTEILNKYFIGISYEKSIQIISVMHMIFLNEIEDIDLRKKVAKISLKGIIEGIDKVIKGRTI